MRSPSDGALPNLLNRALTLILALALAQPAFGSALVSAAKDGNVATALALIEDGADVNERGDNDESALHWAAFRGQLELARRLIAEGARLDARVRNGNTPLHQAAYAGRLDLVRVLLDAGAAIDARDKQGVTPAGWAARNGHDAVLDLLRSRGATGTGATHSRVVHISAPSATRDEKKLFDASPQQRLSRRLGDLPSLVLRVPEDSTVIAPALALSRDLAVRPVTVRPARAPAKARAARAPAARANEREAWLQLGSFRRADDADEHKRRLMSRYGDVLDAQTLSVVSAQVTGRGRYHRVRAGPWPKPQAAATCEALKSRGADCMLVLTRR